MSEADVAALFNEKPKKKKRQKPQKPVEEMTTMEEIKAMEAAHDNSNDIYRVSARIKNLARFGDGPVATLTPAGEALCNTFTHLIVELYTFADTVKNKAVRAKLLEIIKKNEALPGNFIAAMKNGVK